MWKALTRLLFGPQGFCIPRRRSALPRCIVRRIAPSDFATCEEIYRSNEGVYFPSGFYEKFQVWLRKEDRLVLVAEMDGRVAGLGGISLLASEWGDVAVLEFGMVHPSCSRLGLGTALLLARVALLPESVLPSRLMMTSAGPSVSFYSRFGFAYLGTAPVDGQPLGHYVAAVTRMDQLACLDSLNDAEISPELLQLAESAVPKRTIAAGTPVDGHIG
jgi:GNAT superfamily N-acetyltransferase